MKVDSAYRAIQLNSQREAFRKLQHELIKRFHIEECGCDWGWQIETHWGVSDPGLQEKLKYQPCESITPWETLGGMNEIRGMI